MTLLAQRAAIATELEALQWNDDDAFKDVDTFGGELSLEDIKRYAMKTPAARVGLAGINEAMLEGGAKIFMLQWVIVIVVRDTNVDDAIVKRDTMAINLAQAVTALVLGNSWDCATRRPENVRGRNLYSGQVDKNGLAIWAVTWTQRLQASDYDDSELSEFARLHTYYDLAPLDGINEMQGRVNLQGTWMSAYGQIVIDTAAASSIAVAGTYQKASGTTELGNAQGCDMPTNNRLRHTGTVSKPFKVDAALSATVSADALVTFALAINGVVDEDTAIEQEMTAAGGAVAFSLTDIVELDENEYIEVWVTADDTVNVTVNQMSLTAAASL